VADRKDTRFKPGKSGNPGGRPVGSGNLIRAQLTEAWHEIRPILLQKALDGDMAAIRIVAERVCPPIKSSEAAVPIKLPSGSLTERATAVLDALAEGDLNTTQASQLMQALGSLAKVIETDDLAKRIEALEARKP
jgi:hypothetical protein